MIDTRETAELHRFLQNYSPNDGRAFAQLAQLTGKRDVLSAARDRDPQRSVTRGVNALEELWMEIESLGLQNVFEIDLGDVPVLITTGSYVEGYVHGAGASVGRGGRYDGLTGNFGRAEPSVGFVLNLDALTEVVGRRMSHQS